MKNLTKVLFGIIFLGACLKAECFSNQDARTDVITYQYTTDGFLQHVAVYSDGMISTNVEGPREGVQFIMMNMVNVKAVGCVHNEPMHRYEFTLSAKKSYPC